MKTILVGVLLVSSVAAAENKPLLKAVKTDISTSKDLPRDLAPSEVRDRMKAVDTEIAACYLDTVGERRGAGQLEIKLSIHRTGLLDRIDVATPNLPAALAKKIEGCVKSAVKDLAFPARRAETVAVVPYFWQRTAAKHGPQYSCWDPKGCRTK
jgi:hypothetical protein